MSEERGQHSPTRCGRCAHLLPDESLHYCPSCGTPFSLVPPTIEYVEIHSFRLQQWLRRRKQIRGFFGFFALATLFWTGIGLFLTEKKKFDVHTYELNREVVFYIYNDEKFPQLSHYITRLSIAISLQAFEDHFALPIRRVRIVEGELPDKAFSRFLDAEKGVTIDQWEGVFGIYQRRQLSHPTMPLSVFVTNIPMIRGGESRIETRHLGPEGLLSGLGHPALVVVSSHRLLQEQLTGRGPFAQLNDFEQAKFMGEYVLAHELGHALIGLRDYVVSPPLLSSREPHAHPHEVPVRELASQSILTREPTASENSQSPQLGICLMHTDEGGGFEAWRALRARGLGEPARCATYQPALKAHHMRLEAFKFAKSGDYEQAHKSFTQALDLAREHLGVEFFGAWQKEESHFRPGL